MDHDAEDRRPTIPAQLKRRVLVEAGHRCAIATCRHPTTEIAHIIPFAKVKKHEYHNLIALCPNCHTRFDQGEIDRQSMFLYKKKIAFLSDRYSKFELNVLDYLRAHPRVIVHGHLHVKNLLDDGLIENVNTFHRFDYDDGTSEPLEFIVRLTEAGRAFQASWESSSESGLTYDGSP